MEFVEGIGRAIIVVIEARLLFAALDCFDEGIEGFDANDTSKTREGWSAADDGRKDSSGERSGGREEQAGEDEDANPENDGLFPGCDAGTESSRRSKRAMRLGFGALNCGRGRGIRSRVVGGRGDHQVRVLDGMEEVGACFDRRGHGFDRKVWLRTIQ